MFNFKYFALFQLLINCYVLAIFPLYPQLSNVAVINPIDTSFNQNPLYSSLFRRRCPICDSSVYSYCSDKLFHDSCCCHNPNNPYDQLPHQCQFADCSFLHANSCQEHKLITACCCVKK